MMEQGSEFVGDLDDIHQDEEYPAIPLNAVRVQQDGPVQVQQVPSVSAGSRSYALLATGDPMRVGNEDPRRRKLCLVSDQSFYVGPTPNEVSSGYSARIPANTVLEITHQEAVYVRPVADGYISAITENWAS